MKTDAILINTSRGAIIDEDALTKALTEHWIAAAGLDVFEKIDPFKITPVPQFSPLFSMDNVILTPHAAAFSKEASKMVGRIAAEEVLRVFSGNWPENCVNPKVLPRFPLKQYSITGQGNI